MGFAFACPSPLSYCSLALAPVSLRRQYHAHPAMISVLQPTPSTAAISVRLGSARRNTTAVRCFSALTPELKTTLDKVVTSHKVLVFIKGTKEFPQCGFSNNVVQILKSLNVPFETINILENEILRQGLKEYSSWPTFPQLYIDGEFFGGCDITVEAYKSGELQEILEKAMCS
ncbi:Glutaredoxin [Handroanthus impetiginosus]|uniref:Glutaredoxin n=1 Tax=Handroanthus impetiginosus TaxID=429701 RepID=A0A2G9I397_9LAMI|nr:Glutaredoxin [Handroanthus impetiginosus]